MKTVGEQLKDARMRQKVSLHQAEKETKIRIRYLEALEADDFSSFSSQTYAQGFLKNYSTYLGLNSKTMLAFFRRQEEEVSKSALLPKKPHEALKKSRYILTPGKFVFFLIALFLVLLLSYFGIQYRKLQIPPELTLTSPKEQTDVVTSRRIEVSGQTDPDATVTVNGVGVLVRSDGKFFDQVQLFPGKNEITITAASRYGKTTSVVREITVSDQLEETPPTPESSPKEE